MTIIDAILNLINNPIYRIEEFYRGNNRVNAVGYSLEEYIKELFSGSFNDAGDIKREKIENTFSYLGNQNNPPDVILKNGDAIEIKKIESKNSFLALNSSYPKAKLFSDSPMLTQACVNCEEWTEKDMIYAVGVLKNGLLSSLCFVYGVDYAASSSIYERIKHVISEGILTIDGIEFAETRELGRVNRVDPLGITHLRVRGMWGIENPMKTFEYIYKQNAKNKFNFMAIINDEKFATFDSEKISELYNLSLLDDCVKIEDIKILIPDNPARSKNAKLITFCVKDDEI